MSDILKEFIKNDIVSLKRANCKNTDETLLFTISRFENDKVYFSGLETAYSIEDLVPVYLTDKAIKNINYRLPCMASVIEYNQPKPQMPRPKSLNNIFNDEYFSAIIEKYSIMYVHDLQHILIKKRANIEIQVSSPLRNIRVLLQTQTVSK